MVNIIIPERLRGSAPEDLRLCPPLEWMRMLRDGIDVRTSVKLTGCAIALHAHPDGTEARMSVLTLAWQTNTSASTVKRAIGELMDTWLLCVTDKGSAHGRASVPTTYALTVHSQAGLWTLSREKWNRGHP